MIHFIYRISHESYPILNYIGSCKDLDIRIMNHKYRCYNEKRIEYDYKLYQFIRGNNINFDELEFTMLKKTKMNEPKRLEQWYINKHNSIENGLNTNNAHTSPEYKRENKNEYNNEYYQKNIEQIKIYNKEYCKLTWNCILCNKTITKCNKSHHINSIKHQKNIHQNLY
ncbi:MAG: hypothetical protein AABY22_13390 [Nanoarchaeota archaeon]